MGSKVKSWLIGVIGALGAIIAIFFAGKNSGRSQEKAKTNEKVLKNVEIAKKSEVNSDSLTDDERREQLREYVRK